MIYEDDDEAAVDDVAALQILDQLVSRAADQELLRGEELGHAVHGGAQDHTGMSSRIPRTVLTRSSDRRDMARYPFIGAPRIHSAPDLLEDFDRLTGELERRHGGSAG
jgi:hypothetical protein